MGIDAGGLLKKTKIIYGIVVFNFLYIAGCAEFKPSEPETDPIPVGSVRITSPINGVYSNSLSQVITGECEAGSALSITGSIESAPVSVSCSSEGEYTSSVQLQGADGAKNIMVSLQGDTTGEESHSVTVHLDRVAPAAPTITSHTAGSSVGATSQTLQGACESNATVNITGNIVNTPLTTTCSNNAYSQVIALTSAEGNKTLSVTQRDRAGNVSTATNLSLTLVTSTPTAPTITAPNNNSWTNNTSVTLTGVCVTGHTVAISGTVQSAPISFACANNSYSRSLTLTGNDGAKTINVTQSNGVNTSSPRTITVNLDRAAPSAPTITAPANNATVGVAAQTIAGACEANATVSISGDITNAPVSLACNGTSYSQAITLTSGDGVKTLTVAQSDRAGNNSTNRNISVTLTTAAPAAPTITTPANNAYVNTASQTITGGCVAGNTVNVSGSLMMSPVTTTCAGNNTYSRAVTLSSGDGAKTINVTQTNGASTSSQATLTLNLDMVAPSAPTVTSHTSGATVTATAQTLAGACEAQATVTISGNITGSPVTLTCGGGNNYSRAITLTSGNGSKSISLTQQDRAGNTSTARNITLTLNVSTPTNPNWGPVNSTRILLTGHSLVDNPLIDYVEDIATKSSDSFNYNQQNIPGSPIRVRTWGDGGGNPAWSGYSAGKNRNGGDGINFINEVRNPQTLGPGERYDTLVITEAHTSIPQILYENTIGYLRHYHDLMITGNSATRTFFYHSWLDVDKTNPTLWIQHEKNSEVTWECVVSKVNQSLQAVGRTDRLKLLPSGGALVHLVEKIMANEVSGISGTTNAKLNVIFSDSVHLTTTGVYFMALVVYAATYGKKPTGITPASGSGVSAGLATQFQDIAWDYVNTYYNQSGNPAERTMSSCRSFIAANSCQTYWTMKEETNQITNCSNFFGTNSTDNPFRDAVMTPLPAAW